VATDRWSEIERVYNAVRSLPAGARDSYLAEACANDAALLSEVQSLLKY
jgi:hypothetical protein